MPLWEDHCEGLSHRGEAVWDMEKEKADYLCTSSVHVMLKKKKCRPQLFSKVKHGAFGIYIPLSGMTMDTHTI